MATGVTSRRAAITRYDTPRAVSLASPTWVVYGTIAWAIPATMANAAATWATRRTRRWACDVCIAKRTVRMTGAVRSRPPHRAELTSDIMM